MLEIMILDFSVCFLSEKHNKRVTLFSLDWSAKKCSSKSVCLPHSHDVEQRSFDAFLIGGKTFIPWLWSTCSSTIKGDKHDCSNQGHLSSSQEGKWWVLHRQSLKYNMNSNRTKTLSVMYRYADSNSLCYEITCYVFCLFDWILNKRLWFTNWT